MPCQSHPPPFNFPNNTEYKPLSSSLFKFLQPRDTPSLLCTITFLSSLFSNYERHFRSFVFDFIVITKYKITTPLIFLNVYTHAVYSVWSPALSTYFFHLCSTQSAPALHSSLLRWCKKGVTAVLIVFWFKSFSWTWLSHMYRKPIITWCEIWRIARMYQHLPAPILHQILQITMAMKCCIALVKMAPCSNSSGCLWQTAGLTLSCKSQQKYRYGMVTSPFQLKSMTYMTFRAPWPCCDIFSLVTLEGAIQQLFQLQVKWMHPWLVNH